MHTSHAEQQQQPPNARTEAVVRLAQGDIAQGAVEAVAEGPLCVRDEVLRVVRPLCLSGGE